MASPTRAQSPTETKASLEQQLAQYKEELNTAKRVQEQFQFFSEKVLDYAFITLDSEACITSWSRGAERLLGYSQSDVVGKNGSLIFTSEDCAAGQVERELEEARQHGCAEDERWHVRRDGTQFWANGVMTAHRDQQGRLQAYSKVLRDQTARKMDADTHREIEERLRLFSENVTDYALVELDGQGNVSGWNPGASRMFGYTEQQIMGQPVSCLFTAEDVGSNESGQDLSRAVDQGRAEDARWMLRQDGTRFWARWVTTPIKVGDRLRGFAKIMRDETERKLADDGLRSTLESKDLLLREIHHRVKNHVQVIASLVSMQADQAQGAHVQKLFEELRDRVRAIGSLHETLYGSEDLANVDFGPYVTQVLHDLVASYGSRTSNIDLLIETDDLVLSSEQALPLGLIANELVLNALKHGYSDGRNGTIQVSLRYLHETVQEGDSIDSGWCELAVRDYGGGIENPDGIWERRSMGLRIIRLLTRQLHGTVRLDQSQGTCFGVRFPLRFD